MASIKVLIVEDKVLIAEDIAASLKRRGIESAGICATGEEAIEVARTTHPDLIIMDVQLAGAIDGISAAQVILQNRLVPIIYLTEHTDDQTVERAKKTYPANYLAKPFTPDALIRAVELAINNAGKSAGSVNKSIVNDALFLRTDNQLYVKIKLDRIVYLEAGRSYCKIVTDDGEFMMSNSMGHYHDQLNDDFIRVHRSYVINVKRLTSLDGNVIHLDKWQVKTSKEFRESLTKVLNIVK
jgi:DNA-binding LytR/AlgR family response regulator